MTDFQFSSADLTLTIEEFSRRYLEPAVKFMEPRPRWSTLYWDGAYKAYKSTPLDLSVIIGSLPK